MSKVALVVIAIVLVVGGILIADHFTKRQDCEDKALAAAVDTYTVADYPNTSERSQLQTEYKNRYLETCR